MNNRKRQKLLKEFIKNLKHSMHVDDDIITNENKVKLQEILKEAESIDYHEAEKAELFLIREPDIVETLLPKKTSPQLREYADVLAVALVVAFGIRAIFFQPFKIPTSSMQPTLFGIHYIAKKDLDKYSNVPEFLRPYINLDQRAYLKVKKSGFLTVNSFEGHTSLLSQYTKVTIAGIEYDLPGTVSKVYSYLGFYNKLRNELKRQNIEVNNRTMSEAAAKGIYVSKGEVLCDGWLSTGDHLFVNRFTHYFTGLKRGDVIVFNTEGIIHPNGTPLKDHGYFYIKRLVAIPGDEIEIRDNVLYLKKEGATEARPIEEFEPRFKKIYSGKGGYHGHLNQEFTRIGDANNPIYVPSFFGRRHQKIVIPKGFYFAMGDNSVNSSDGRTWGLVPRRNIVGKAFNIFWPFSRRWGFVDSQPPLDIKTDLDAGLPAMHLQ